MRVVLAADHEGFDLKEILISLLKKKGIETQDLGTSNHTPVDYPDSATDVVKPILDGAVPRGILICGSGVGASVAANKFRGIRAGLCHDTYSAHQGVEHDNMNVLVLGGRVIGEEMARELVRAYVNAHFTGEERHVRRLTKVHAIEEKN